MAASDTQVLINQGALVLGATKQLFDARTQAFAALLMIGNYEAADQVRLELHALLDSHCDAMAESYRMSRRNLGLV
ncbi:MAG: hypothetical protein ACHP9V_05870 [Terriglobales bacterium]